MSRIVIGLDFGTSNTSVSYADLDDPKNVKTAILERSEDNTEYKSIPSAMFYIPELNKLLTGRKAINAYIEHEYEGRLLRNLKSILDDIDAKTKISDSKQLSYFDFIYNFLKKIKTRVIEEAGSDNIVGIVVGRPVHFFDNDDERDKKAEKNLRRIIEKLGFQNIVFLPEPIAASFALETEIKSDSNAFIADLGGGTSDFTAIALGPSHAKKTNRKDDVFATTGIKIGGTDFDRSFSLNRFMPELGYETLITLDNGTTASFPTDYFNKLSDAFKINELYNYSVIQDLERNLIKSLAKKKIEDLLRIVKKENGHNLITEIETGKKHLSLEDTFIFNKMKAFAIPEDSYMTEDYLKDNIEAFKTNIESYLSKTNSEELLNEIKADLKYRKNQYVTGIHDYTFLFGKDYETNDEIMSYISELENVIYNKLNQWENKISSLSLADITPQFNEQKDIINQRNTEKIKQAINDYSRNLKLNFGFEAVYSFGYDVFNKLLKINLDSIDIEHILEKVKDYIIKYDNVKDALCEKLKQEFSFTVIQNFEKECALTGEDLTRRLIIEYKNKNGTEKYEALKKEIIEAEFKSRLNYLVSNIKTNIFYECNLLGDTTTLLQNIKNITYMSELSVFVLPTQSELIKYAKESGSIYEDAVIKRNEFESSIKEYIPRLQKSIKECIAKSGKKVSDFQYLVMTGGSSRIPMIREAIKSCFDKNINIVCEDLEQKIAQNWNTIPQMR